MIERLFPAARDVRDARRMTPDDATASPEELERIARSLSMDGSLGRADTMAAVEALRRLADIERSRRRA